MIDLIKLFVKDVKLQISKYLNKYHGEDYPWFKFYENVPKTLNYPNKTLYEMIEKISLEKPKEVALEYFRKKITYKKFNEDITECARGLREIGVKRGDFVSICMTNTPEAVVFVYAVNMVGGVCNMIHPLASEEETKKNLKKTSSKYILCLDLVLKKIQNIDKDVKLKKIIVSKINNKMPWHLSLLYLLTKKHVKVKEREKTISYRKLIREGKYFDLNPKSKTKAKEDAIVVYSGGTTGDPKGVVLTNYNVNVMGIQGYKMTYPINEGDSILATLPIFHNFGLIVSIHTALIHGLKAILVPGFQAKDFGKLIKKYKPNFIVGVPTMYEALINSKIKNKSYMKNVHTIICGGDLLNKSLRDKVDAYTSLHGCKAKIRMGYGLSETSGACSLTPRNYFKDGGIGIPFPDTFFKIVKINTKKELKTNEVGEICIYGPTVMDRYLNDVRETNNVLKRHSDGRLWLHTGDIGYLDKDGMLFFKSRLKRMIVSNGYNIYPQYLEKIVMEHPAVETAAIIGIPHKYKQMVPKVYIILKENFENTEILRNEIKNFCQRRINNYEKIEEYVYVKTLPQTLMGKVAFTELEGKE